MEIKEIVEELESYLKDLKTRWDQVNPGNHSWFFITRDYLYSATKFLVDILDECILFIEDLIPGNTGAEKKAAVLAIMLQLYQYILLPVFPIWLKPFAPIIQNVVLIIANYLIDFIIAKYNTGYWLAKPYKEDKNGKADQIT